MHEDVRRGMINIDISKPTKKNVTNAKRNMTIDSVQFRKEWTSPEVIAHIRGIFGNIMHAGVERDGFLSE